VRLLAGRFFSPLEIKTYDAYSAADPYPPTAVLTKSMAERFFPDGDAVGKYLAIGGNDDFGTEIIGVVSDVARPWVNWGNYYDAMFLPYHPTGIGRWIVRVKPGVDVLAVGQAVQDALVKADRELIVVDVTTFAKARKQAYSDSVLIAALLAFFSVLVLLITLLGIIGLTSFWITQRTRQIGVRRALGAKSSEIVSYFRQENFLLSIMGCLLGTMLAYALNFLLSKHLDAGALSLPWLLGATLLMLLIGQLAIWAPTARAARIPPALATRI
jgi:putative ABC transport system permease protein